MVDTERLREIIAERGLSQRKVAKKLGMTEKTFYAKMKKRVFDSDEMSEMATMLNITDPGAIFFAWFGAYYAPPDGLEGSPASATCPAP